MADRANINKYAALSIALKHISSFYDYNILGIALMWVTDHDYLGVTISSVLNWLGHVKKFKQGLQNPCFT